MSTLWNSQDVSITAKTWDRSWRGEEFTDLGTDFTIVMHMERVTVDANNKVIAKEQLPNITRSLSQVISDPDVQAYLTLKQTLVKKWLDEDVAATAILSPEPDSNV
jgi:hypothetical protein